MTVAMYIEKVRISILEINIQALVQGVRWNSPLGPLRFEYGWVIEGRDVKKPGMDNLNFNWCIFLNLIFW